MLAAGWHLSCGLAAGFQQLPSAAITDAFNIVRNDQPPASAPQTPWKPKAAMASPYPSPFAAFGAAAVRQERRTRPMGRRKGPEEQDKSFC
eukprot:s671_g5.t1